MLLTSGLLFMAMREIWGWGLLRSAAVAGAFVLIDVSFFLAKVVQVADGGYVPLLLAAMVYAVMWVWHRGSAAVAQRLDEQLVPVAEFMRSIEQQNIPRVPGTAVFLTRTTRDTPPVMVWHVQHNRALHRSIVVVNATVESVPWIKEAERLQLEQVQADYWRVTARFGFMEKPDLPAVLNRGCSSVPGLALSDAVYYLGHGTVVSRDDGQGLPAWQEGMYAAMERNAVHFSDFFRLPSGSVVMIGRQIEI